MCVIIKILVRVLWKESNMEFIKYNPIEEEKGCVPRALSKAYQKDYK